MRARALAPLLWLAACTAPGANPAALPLLPDYATSMHRYQRVYILSAGDQLDVQVARLPEWTRTVTVRPDGAITLPRLGDIAVAGLSVPEASDAIAQALAARVRVPEVTVIVQNPRDDVVFVTGEVGRSTPVPLRQARTVAEALVVAGGTNHAANVGRVAVIRLGEDGRLRAITVPRASRGAAGQVLAMQAMPLQSGDLIVVPERGASQFARAVGEIVNAPLNGVNALFTPYLQFRLIDRL